MGARTNRVATLNAAEDQAWIDEFVYAKEQGKTDLKADAASFRNLRKRFPRLRKYSKFAP
jgi:hypothetical protein